MKILEVYQKIQNIRERIETLDEDYKDLCEAAEKLLNMLSAKCKTEKLPLREYDLTEHLYIIFDDDRDCIRLEPSRPYSLREEILGTMGLDYRVDEDGEVAAAFYIIDHAPEILERLDEVEKELAKEDERVRRALDKLKESIGMLALAKRVER